eukprot:1049913-Amphidinium_carterae.1
MPACGSPAAKASLSQRFRRARLFQLAPLLCRSTPQPVYLGQEGDWSTLARVPSSGTYDDIIS